MAHQTKDFDKMIEKAIQLGFRVIMKNNKHFVYRRFHTGAALAIKRCRGGVDDRGDCTDFNWLWTIGDSNYDGSGGVDVDAGVCAVHCLDPRCPAQGATLRNLEQKPYLPTYTLRQQQSRINQTWRNISPLP
jgi:hypothetical protein